MSESSYRSYLATLKLVFLKAVHDLYPKHEVFLLNSLNNGLYGKIIFENHLFKTADYENIKDHMRTLIQRNLPISVLSENYEEIKASSIDPERKDIQSLMDTTLWTGIKKVKLDDYVDYLFTLPHFSTGSLAAFDLYSYSSGFILKYPTHDPNVLEDKIDTPKMANIFEESDRWQRILEIQNAGAINKKVLEHGIRSLIRINEALHNKNLAKISEQISNNENIKVITISGPSSSGKTTFANRLFIQLKADEVNPLVISLDNYYIGRKNIPFNEHGEKDYESMEALDIKLLNQNLVDLIAGKEVILPIYNFISGEREKEGNKIKLSERHGVIIIEGIHGLNEAMTKYIPKEQKFKIYISCLTQLNLDNHNRIATSDVREIRRIVRDSLSRNTSAEETLNMWSSVRRGEEKYIFPFQEEADVIFNSNLVYEMGVLKNAALKELVRIPVSSPHYEEARRLIGLLSCFLSIEASDVPDDSLLKEFIGHSFFYSY